MMEEKPKVKIKRGETRVSDRQNWWPYLLIGIGLFFLLGNLGIIAGLFRLWPLILVAVGVMLLFGKTGNPTVKHEHFSEPVEATESARVRLNLAVGEHNVTSTPTPDTLIDADLTFVGEVDFTVSGEQEKVVSLSQSPGFTAEWLNPANWFNQNQKLRWDVGLNPNVPIDLDVHGGVGAARLDLGNLNLTHVEVGGGVGEIDLTLPARGEYDGYLKIGVGAFRITVPSGANADLRIKGGVGECNVTLPLDVAVRLDARTGIGDIHVPSRLTRVSGGGDGISKSGVWETADFASAERKVVIDFEGGVGELRVR
jgi:hypothetical protein